MICTRCSKQILKKQPYSRTKRGPHHFRKTDCKRNPIEPVETLWACSCGFQWFAKAGEPPNECPSCLVSRTEPEPSGKAEQG